MKWCLSFLLPFYISVCPAQQLTGEISLNEYGFSFTIPDPWMGQEVEDGIVLVSSEHSGFIYLTLNSFESAEQMHAEIAKGINGDQGISLRPVGKIDKISPRIVGSVLEGVIEDESAKAYCVALLNTGGYGVNILAATNASMYDAVHEEAAVKLAKSFRFRNVDTIDVGLVAQWQNTLDHTSLHYLDSYSSGLSGGSNTRTRIDLCPSGQFRYSSSSSVSINTGGTSAQSSQRSQGEGEWEIRATTDGGAKLQLTFQDGEVWDFELTSNQEGHTFLNGVRYMRILAEDPNGYGPSCP